MNDIRTKIGLTILFFCAALSLMILSFKEPASTANVTKSEKQVKDRLSPNLAQQDVVDSNKQKSNDEIVQQSIDQVLDIYANTSRFPVSSRPVQHPEEVQTFEPYEETSVSSHPDITDKDHTTLRFSFATDRYQYYEQDIIGFRAKILGVDPSTDYVELNAEIFTSDDHETTQKVEFHPLQNKPGAYFSEVYASTLLSKFKSNQFYARVSVAKQTEQVEELVAFRVDRAIATVTGVALSKVDGSNLVIPVEVSAEKEGNYEITGVLFNSSNKEPLLRLQTVGQLEIGNGYLDLKADYSALKHKGSEGPYLLRIDHLRRATFEPDEGDQIGNSLSEFYDVQGASFSDYSQEEYLNETAIDRLEMLRSIINQQAGVQ